jgi:IMP dehydrogenase
MAKARTVLGYFRGPRARPRTRREAPPRSSHRRARRRTLEIPSRRRYGCSMALSDRIVTTGLTFDDLLLLPGRSEVLPTSVDVSTRFSRRVHLEIPISSSAMDTVTEAHLAIALARQGGIGIIHRNLTPADQARLVDQVKRSANGVILDPVTLAPEADVARARELMEKHEISGIPVVEGGKVAGILTRRDLRFVESGATKVADVMTRRLVTAAPGTTLEQAKKILHQAKVEKLLLVDGDGRLAGLITMKDIKHLDEYPNACRDGRGRLRVGAAVGVHDDERYDALVKAGADVLVVDTAHGHSLNVIQSVQRLKQRHDIDVVAGNIATAEAAIALIEAGADGLKVGIGPGSICTTRVVAGIGVPMITSIMECAAAAWTHHIPVIADGGIRYSGDITKALAVGASTTMIGNLFAGTDESPGEVVLYQGRSFKEYRGMGSIGAMRRGSRDRYFQDEFDIEGGDGSEKLVPEGIEGRVAHKGSVAAMIHQLVGGLRAGMGYCGAKDIPSLQAHASLIRVTSAGVREGHVHDVIITKEAPNYRVESR